MWWIGDHCADQDSITRSLCESDHPIAHEYQTHERIERTTEMNKFIKGVVVIATAAIATVSIAACSSSGSSSDKKPVATIATLSGQSTSVKLDAGFTGALTSLGLTPGVLGTATLTDGSVHFPITGGHVTVYKKGAVDPYVQGDIQHNGSGLSLTAGSTVVQLQNFDINPGSSQLFGDVSVNGTVAADARLPVQSRRQHVGPDHDHQRGRHADRHPGPGLGHRGRFAGQDVQHDRGQGRPARRRRHHPG